MVNSEINDQLLADEMNTFDYIKSDLHRYSGKYSLATLLRHYFLNKSFRYSFWLRLASHNNILLRLTAKIVHRNLSEKYNIQIPTSTSIGYGLYIGHHMCIVVNPTAQIGNNVNLSQFTTIGSNNGKAAVIGDSVYIGPGTSIVEDVVIGSNATIGAGSVVTRDVPKNSTVAGCPARILNHSRPGRYIQNSWPVVEK